MNIYIKSLSLMVLAVVLPLQSVKALDNVEVVQDYEKNLVSIEGDTDSMVTVILLKDGKSLLDIHSASDINTVVQYAETLSVDESGLYSINIELQNSTGNYPYYAVDQHGSSINGVLHFIIADDMKRAIEAIVNADKASIAGVIEENKEYLGIDISTYDELKKDKLAMLIYSIRDNLKPDSINQANALINAAVAAEEIAEGKNANISETLYPILDNRAIKWCDSEIFTGTMEKTITDGLSKSYKSISDFNDAFCEKLVIAIVKNPNGWGNVKSIISDFSTEIGIDSATLNDSIYSKLAGKSYDSYAALKSAILSLVSSSSQGGGGSSSGNRSAGGASYLGTPKTEETQLTEIKTFNDLDNVEWAREAILRIYNKGIVSGRDDSRYYPNDSVTREEFLKMLVLVSGIEPSPYTNSFDDVSFDDWFAMYVESAVKAGICQGIDYRKFGTGLNITREDMAVMVYNILSSHYIAPVNSRIAFNDSQIIADYAADAVEKLQTYGIINGRDNNMFAPKDYVTRAEAAVIINVLLKYFE